MIATFSRASLVLAAAILIPACGGGSSGAPRTVTPPVVSLLTPAGNQTGNVTFSYQLSDNEGDTCSIAVSFSLNGGATWSPATSGPGGDGIAALAASSGAGTAHTFVWNSLADGVGLTAIVSALVRIVPADPDPGPAAVTSAFNVVNRLFTAPTATVTTPVGTQSGLVPISYSLIDAESDPCAIAVAYSLDGGASFSPATGAAGSQVTGLTASPGAGSAHGFLWDSITDGVASGLIPASVRFRITPSDPAIGSAGTTNAFSVSNRPFTPPSSSVTTPAGVQTGTVAITYTLTDAESDACSIVAQYSTDGGTTFKPATAAGGDGVSGLSSSPGGTSHSFLWNSAGDGVAPALANVSVRFRITPADGSVGTAGTSGAFDVNNRPFTPPSASVTAPGGTSSGLIALSFTLTDAEGDPCSVQVEYSLNGGATYAPATPGPGSGPRTGLSSGGAAHGFVWNSVADGVGTAAVRVRVTPNDGAAGTAGTADLTVDNSSLSSGGTLPGFPVTVNGTVRTDMPRSIATDGAAIYVLGFDNLDLHDVPQSDLAWRIEKRDALTGAAVAAFGSSGALVYNPGPGFDLPVKILVDGGAVYVVGLREVAGGFQVDLRRFDATTGAAGFVVAGPMGAAGDGIPLTWTAAVDANAVYVAGPEVVSATESRWRIEKRDKTTGAPVGGFSATSPSHGSIDGCFAMTLDATSMWLVGVQEADPGLSSNGKIRIEKRLLATGALVPGFGSAGVVTIEAGPGDDLAEDCVRDAAALYVYSRVETGFATGVFSPRLDKLDLSTGATLLSLSPTGAVDPTGELPARHLAIDGGSLYVASVDNPSDLRWRIEKRSTADLSLVPSFGAAGIRAINPSGGDDRPLDVLFLGGVLYAAGSDASVDGGRWRIEGLWK